MGDGIWAESAGEEQNTGVNHHFPLNSCDETRKISFLYKHHGGISPAEDGCAVPQYPIRSFFGGGYLSILGKEHLMTHIKACTPTMTHIKACTPTKMVDECRSRSHTPHSLSGWEGSAHDSLLLLLA
ncbi:unnamed protein product [Urochloa humidicola]